MEKEALEWGGGCSWVLARSWGQDGGRRRGQSRTGPLGNSQGLGGGYMSSRSGFVAPGPPDFSNVSSTAQALALPGPQILWVKRHTRPFIQRS